MQCNPRAQFGVTQKSLIFVQYDKRFCRQDAAIIHDQFLLRHAEYKGTFIFQFGLQNNKNVLMK